MSIIPLDDGRYMIRSSGNMDKTIFDTYRNGKIWRNGREIGGNRAGTRPLSAYERQAIEMAIRRDAPDLLGPERGQTVNP